jgi:alkylation response protein AidB-like acyl-CoA dehydrogenase
MQAGLVLVPATRLDDRGQRLGPAVFAVDPEASGASRQPVAGAFRVEALLELDGVVVDEGDLLGGPTADGAAVLSHLAQQATVALCMAQAGACAAAVELTAEYTKTREQFGKPIASFQAVGQRAADAYVDAQAVRLTAWQAAWRLSQGLPAAAEVATAKYWAADGGQRVVHAATHLHGGVGVDREYALHRYFLWTEQIELTLGGATESLLGLGRLLADDPV